MKIYEMNKVVFVATLAITAMACSSGDSDSVQNGGSSESPESSIQTAAEDSSGHSSTVRGVSATKSFMISNIDADIFGVKLGMTPEEANRALATKSPEHPPLPLHYTTIERQLGLVPYTPEKVAADAKGAYVESTMVNLGGSSGVTVTFAKPPADNVVVQITRKQHFSGTDKTSVEAFRKALIEKYGEPVEEPEPHGVIVYKWLFPADGADCNPLKPNLPATHHKHWPTVVNQISHQPKDCATALIYSLTASDGIVSYVEARLGNVGQTIVNTTATVAYQKEMREKAAEAKRKAATQAPQL